MKNCAVIFGIYSLSLVGLAHGNPPQAVVGRTIYHADDSRTESVRDPNTRELTESTYNTAGQLTVKKIFLLNEKGEPMQGNVYDGRGNLVARVQSIYDEFGRRKEDRLMNLRGEVFQQVVHEYGKDGKALPPKVVNLNSQAAPMMKPAAIDYTQPIPENSSRFAPQQIPAASQPAPTAPVSEPTGQEEKPKANFFKKLFKK
ncbi:hypothetical protein EI77_02552 [Prosthecobacter fusiformis]|uniref:YD repeat-containing protein n=1 Tax=Prosthecobacter fusiformis TaxID=48464 RepID=A0A4R7S1X6_9BACT|nr:hypothetical protein [Prosthecobacter fusiformis]TDU71428.1 hypothetical protein EI77_02552 [Prosthecobacter fusiformis]